MALKHTLAFFAFWFYTRPGQLSDLSLSFLVVQLVAVPRMVMVLVMLKVMGKYFNGITE